MNNVVISGAGQASILRCIVVSLGMTILVFLGSTEALLRTFGHSGLLPSGYVGTFTSNALAEDAVVALSPVLAVIPFSGVYVDDLKSKFARFLLLRSSYFDYLISRILIAFFCGGGSIAFGCLSAWGISALVFFPTQLAGEADWVVVNLVVHKLILLFCNGGLWAVIGLSLSTVMESKYVAYISPFIVYYLLVILYERYFPDAWFLYPKNWLNPEIWPYGVVSAAVFLLELTFFAGLLFYFRGRRRLESL